MLKKFKNWLLDTPKEEIEQQEEQPKVTVEKPKLSDNEIDTKQVLIDLVVGYFKPTYGSAKFDESVVVWVNNSALSAVVDDALTDSVKIALENAQLTAASKADIRFEIGNPPQGAIELKDNIFIQKIRKEIIANTTIAISSAKARISIFENKGVLKKEEYVLDSSVQTEYTIGRGAGESRKNQIIIADEYEEVSRLHAKIAFVAGKGFCLQSLNANNRTFIHRNNIERAHDIFPKDGAKLLRRGDVIELGKSVSLLFEIIE